MIENVPMRTKEAIIDSTEPATVDDIPVVNPAILPLPLEQGAELLDREFPGWEDRVVSPLPLEQGGVMTNPDGSPYQL